MKINDTHFEDYLNNYDNTPIRSKINIENSGDILPFDIIIYGAHGIGKYTEALAIIREYSLTKLKYEKKLAITYNKQIYYFKISDIHFEIDMSLLGCNSKLLWHEIYNQITDIITSKSEKRGIILCKNFHEIHSELLDVFYSYMQNLYNKNIDIKFIFLTESISFLPDNILNRCKYINLARPSKHAHFKIFKTKFAKEDDDLYGINNLKDLKRKIYNEKDDKKITAIHKYKQISNEILEFIIHYENIKYVTLRDLLYDICIFDLNIDNCIWYIITELSKRDILDNEKMIKILNQTYNFFRYYNNNYRPIYHLEKYILYIVTIIHEL